MKPPRNYDKEKLQTLGAGSSRRLAVGHHPGVGGANPSPEGWGGNAKKSASNDALPCDPPPPVEERSIVPRRRPLVLHTIKVPLPTPEAGPINDQQKGGQSNIISSVSGPLQALPGSVRKKESPEIRGP